LAPKPAAAGLARPAAGKEGDGARWADERPVGGGAPAPLTRPGWPGYLEAAHRGRAAGHWAAVGRLRSGWLDPAFVGHPSYPRMMFAGRRTTAGPTTSRWSRARNAGIRRQPPSPSTAARNWGCALRRMGAVNIGPRCASSRGGIQYYPRGPGRAWRLEVFERWMPKTPGRSWKNSLLTAGRPCAAPIWAGAGDLGAKGGCAAGSGPQSGGRAPQAAIADAGVDFAGADPQWPCTRAGRAPNAQGPGAGEHVLA